MRAETVGRPPRVIFIGGLGRSGSTLLERVIAGLHEVSALGEVANLWKRMLHYPRERCGCGDPLLQCRFWNAVGDEAFGGWHRLDLPVIVRQQRELERIRNILWLARSRVARRRRPALVAHLDLYRRLYQAAASVSGSSVLVDSSKSPGLAFCLRWASDLDLRMVHLVRDPRGVAYSFTKQVSRPEADDGETGSRGRMPRRNPGRSAINWVTHNAAMGVLARTGRSGPDRRPMPVHRLRYEHFLADPAETVRKLATSVGLTPNERELAHLRNGYAELEPIHSVAGNPMRFTSGRVELRADDAWHRQLPPGQRRLVGALCLPLLASYGYPIRMGATMEGPQ